MGHSLKIWVIKFFAFAQNNIKFFNFILLQKF